MQPSETRHLSTSSEPAGSLTSIVASLKDGEIGDALELLRTSGAVALEGLSVLEDVLPLALTTIAELYDKYGVTGREGPYFDFAQELWKYLPPEQSAIPDMLTTFLIAGFKFNQTNFVRWVLPLVQKVPAINIHRLASDRMYELNQLRHCALYYICKNGSFELYDLLAKACGAVSPLALEAKVFERQHAAALSTGQRPPQPSAVPRPDTAARAMGVSEAPKRASEPDAPSLYLAIRGGHADFIRYVLHRLPSAQLQARVLRVVVVHGIIPLDDSDSAHALYMFCLDPSPPSEGGDSIPALEQRSSAAPASSVAPYVDLAARAAGSLVVVDAAAGAGSHVASAARSLSGEEQRSESRTLSSGGSVESGALTSAAPSATAEGGDPRFATRPADPPSATAAHSCIRPPVDARLPTGSSASGVGRKPAHKRVRANTAASAGQLSQMSAFSSRRDSVAGGNAPIDVETVLHAFAAARERPSIISAGTSTLDDSSNPPTSATAASPVGPVKSGASSGSLGLAHAPPPRRQYLALHLCLFLHEGSADPPMVRWPPSRRYAEWLLRVIPWVVSQPLSKMRWAGLASAPTPLAAPVSPTRGPATAAAAPVPLRNSALGVDCAVPSGDTWQDWLPFHSACAAGVLDVAQRLVASDRDALSAPSRSLVPSFSPGIALSAGDAHPQQPLLVHPARIAIEASYWTERYDVVGWLTQMLSPTQLDAQVYGPCKYLSTSKPDFVKLLCKVTPLGLRALRHGSALGLGSSGARRGGGRSSGAQFLLESALLAGREAADARGSRGTPGAPGSAASRGNSGSGSGGVALSREDVSDGYARPGGTIASARLGRRHKGAGRTSVRGGSPASSVPREEEAPPDLAVAAGAALKTLTPEATTLLAAGIALLPEPTHRARSVIAAGKGFRVVRFRPRSDSPMSPRVRDALSCDPAAERGGSPRAVAAGMTRSESNGSLQSTSYRARAVSVDAGSSLVAAHRTRVQQPPHSFAPEAARSSALPPTALSAPSSQADGTTADDDFESAASRKARKRAAALAAPRVPSGGGESVAPTPSRRTLSGTSESPSMTKPVTPAVARRPPLATRPSDVLIAPPVAAPSYAATLTGLGETILPVQAIASQAYASSNADHLIFGFDTGVAPLMDRPSATASMSAAESSRPSLLPGYLRGGSRRANDQLGLLLELDAWLGAPRSETAPVSEMAPPQSLDFACSGVGHSTSPVLPSIPQVASPTPTVVHPQQGLLSLVSAAANAAGSSPAVSSHVFLPGAAVTQKTSSVAVGAVCGELSLETLSGIDSAGVAMFRGRFGRLGATIKRFESVLHPANAYITALAALTDLSGDDVSDAAVHAGLLHLQRFLGDAEGGGFSLVAFEPCDSLVSAGLEALQLSDADRVPSGPRREALEWCKQFVSAIAALHAVGTVHGAILPENALLRKQSVRVADACLLRAILCGAIKQLVAHADDENWKGSVFVVERALRSCAHDLAAPEVRTSVERLRRSLPRRQPSCRQWAESVEAEMSCMFSLAADAFSLGHVVFEFLAGGDAASRLRDGVCEIPPVTLRSGACGGASFGDPIVRDLVSRLTRRVPEARIAVSAALRHPAFMSPQQLVDCVVSFSAAMGRAYAHGIPPWVVGGDTSLLAPSVSSSPELDYLEQAFVLHEEWGDGGGSVDWILRLDRQRLVCWPEPAPAASPSDSKEQSFSSPRQFFELYRSSRRPCLGLVKAVHVLAGLRAPELVSRGLFSNCADVCQYFLRPFPWLALEVIEASKIAGLIPG